MEKTVDEWDYCQITYKTDINPGRKLVAATLQAQTAGGGKFPRQKSFGSFFSWR